MPEALPQGRGSVVVKPSVMYWLITDKHMRPQNSASLERGPQWTDRGGF
jgi:hypothetical protein